MYFLVGMVGVAKANHNTQYVQCTLIAHDTSTYTHKYQHSNCFNRNNLANERHRKLHMKMQAKLYNAKMLKKWEQKFTVFLYMYINSN